eukprot:5262484-Amphidinium_carterae.1
MWRSIGLDIHKRWDMLLRPTILRTVFFGNADVLLADILQATSGPGPYCTRDGTDTRDYDSTGKGHKSASMQVATKMQRSSCRVQILILEVLARFERLRSLLLKFSALSSASVEA